MSDDLTDKLIQQEIEDTNAPPEGDYLTIKIYSPYHVYFNSYGRSLTAENDTGVFDILPRHHNFMTLVNACEVKIRTDDQDDITVKIAKGVLHVRNNKITLFLDV